MIILLITALCNLIELFVTDYFIGLVFRIIPAFLYPIAVSSALTIVGKTDANDTNKVVFGISAGSILGLSITSYLGFNFGYQITMLWFVLINVLALVLTFMFVPNFEGNKEPVLLKISHAKSKLFLFSVVYIFLMVVGISITYNYIPTFLSEVTRIDGEMLFVTLFLMGLSSMFGTTLSGYLFQKSITILILGTFINYPFTEMIVLLVFGIFDGSACTVSQYWVTSSLRESPEFANGIFLLLCNLGIFIGTMIGGMIINEIHIVYIFFGSVIMMILSIPFVLIRIKTYPDAV